MVERIRVFNDMLDDVRGAINNEKLWANGAENNAATKMHFDNAALLEERFKKLSYLNDIYTKFEKLSPKSTVKNSIINDAIFAIESILEEEKLAETEYVDFFETLLKEAQLASMTEDGTVFMITKMSIINRLKKEPYLFEYTEKERPCKEAFLQEITNNDGEKCTRYFVRLANGTIDALKGLQAKYSDIILSNNNSFGDFPELVFFDANYDTDTYFV